MKTLSVILFIALASAFSSCGKGGKTALQFTDEKMAESADNKRIEAQKKASDEARELAKVLFLAQKTKAWDDILFEARTSYKKIQPIVENKCSSCHDSEKKLPLYGRILKPLNPVYKHQFEGLKSLDVSGGFPFKAQGNPPTISIMKAIRNAVTEREMPIKAYTTVYPGRKINVDDEALITDWVDPIVLKLSEFDKTYNPSSKDVADRAQKILELKCFRCHANGNSKGGFANMEKVEVLQKSKYINHERPDLSELYLQVTEGKMPPSKKETLDIDEMNTIRDWLETLARKNP